MKWQWKLGTFAGIDVFVHATFLLIVAWYGFVYWQQTGTLSGALEGVAFILLLFAAVTLHEYGHALTARKFGVRTRDITLYPIGGVARLERMPDKPIQELWVALAGPAVNVVIAAALFAWLVFTDTLVPLRELTLATGSFVERLMMVNIFLVAFNLIPAFPMDGGRVLRAVLAMNMDYVRATQIAATVGQGLAFLFGFIGLFTNPFLLFIAFFVWMGASQEASMVQMKNALGGIPVSRAMLTDFETLSPRDTLARMVQLVLAGSQRDFPVVEDGRVLGIVTRDDFLKALTQHGEDWPVSQVMHVNLPIVDSYEMVENALLRLQECGIPVLPVTHGGQLVGIITPENITEYLMIRSALRARANVPIL
ncbi:MAG: site-2 protease family protein [Anaerolineales bacterium]|nr:site-2 protease family protein [Anaerolineales bacterium]